MRGAAVRHPQYGDGIVVEIDPRRGANVDFGYVMSWMPLQDLVVHEGVEPTSETADTPQQTAGSAKPPTSLTQEVVAARRAVLALKLGQVLEENVHELSVGIEAARSTMERAVESARRRQPQSLFIEGSWGTGKTHLLTLLSKIASDRGFATASVILDGEGVTLSEPMGLMEAVLGSLRWPGELAPCGVGSRMAELRRQTTRTELQRRVGWRMANALFGIPQRAYDDPEAMKVIEDYFMLALVPTRANEKLRRLWHWVRLRPLKAWPRAERPGRMRELLKGWAEICALTGAKGLVVIFDEVDVEYARLYGASSRYRQLLLEAFGNLLKRDRSPILLAFGYAPTSDDWGNGSDAADDMMASISGMVRVEAPGQDVRQLQELGLRLQELYARAYPQRTSSLEPQEIQQRIEHFALRHFNELDSPTRQFVRGTLELLDVIFDQGDNRLERG